MLRLPVSALTFKDLRSYHSHLYKIKAGHVLKITVSYHRIEVTGQTTTTRKSREMDICRGISQDLLMWHRNY